MEIPEILSIPLIDLYREAFSRGLFEFITVTKNGYNEKQHKALQILTDTETEELLFGGAAGGSKTWTACAWLLFMCLNYPGTKWFIGREELNRITQSTLITFLKVVSAYSAKDTFKFNAQKNILVFENGSRIDLLDLRYLPSDPMFERFGSTEYTGGLIEEAGETHFGAYEILKTRIGRHMNDVYNLPAKLLMTCNPKKGWLYTEFYLPAKKGILATYKRFLQSLVTDNPNISQDYIERLKRTKNESQKQRLLFGNWDYDDAPDALCSYESIIAIFENNHVQKTGVKKITIDAARFGSDKARVCVWDGWVVIEHHFYDISATTEIQDCIAAMRVKHQIAKNDCICDADGIGGGIVDNCGILGFVNNAKPILPIESKENPLNKNKQENYMNLQVQCCYGLAEIINEKGIWIECDLSPDQKEEIELELSWLRTYKADDERKLRILPKEDIKKNIGHSPDWRDVLMMRYYFELNAPREVDFGW